MSGKSAFGHWFQFHISSRRNSRSRSSRRRSNPTNYDWDQRLGRGRRKKHSFFLCSRSCLSYLYIDIDCPRMGLTDYKGCPYGESALERRFLERLLCENLIEFHFHSLRLRKSISTTQGFEVGRYGGGEPNQLAWRRASMAGAFSQSTRWLVLSIVIRGAKSAWSLRMWAC